MTKYLWVAALALALAGAAARPRAIAAQVDNAAEQAPAPTLIVLIAIDQLRPDYLDRFGAQLTGGLGRLVSEGAVFKSGDLDHATTETAPGHASMLSGRFPRSHGVLRNPAGVQDPSYPRSAAARVSRRSASAARRYSIGFVWRIRARGRCRFRGRIAARFSRLADRPRRSTGT